MYSLNQFSTSCLIPSNQKGHKRQDCASGSPTQLSKGLWKAGLRIWITNSALHASSGNQEMAIERENIMDCKFGTSCLNPAIKWKYKSGIASKFGTYSWQLHRPILVLLILQPVSQKLRESDGKVPGKAQ